MRKCALAAFFVAFALPSFNAALEAQAQDKTFELKLSHWVPPSHPLQKALEDWGASVETASGGSLKYKIFPAQQLGKGQRPCRVAGRERSCI